MVYLKKEIIELLEELFFCREMVKVIEHFIIHEKWEQSKEELRAWLEIPPRLMFKIISRLIDLENCINFDWSKRITKECLGLFWEQCTFTGSIG